VVAIGKDYVAVLSTNERGPPESGNAVAGIRSGAHAAGCVRTPRLAPRRGRQRRGAASGRIGEAWAGGVDLSFSVPSTPPIGAPSTGAGPALNRSG
jgi:hypothetical protein